MDKERIASQLGHDYLVSTIADRILMSFIAARIPKPPIAMHDADKHGSPSYEVVPEESPGL